MKDVQESQIPLGMAAKGYNKPQLRRALRNLCALAQLLLKTAARIEKTHTDKAGRPETPASVRLRG